MCHPTPKKKGEKIIPVCALSRGRLLLKCDGTRAETRFRLSAKRTSPFKSEGASVESTTGSRGVRVSGSNAGYTMFRGSMKATHSIRQFPLHFPSRASPCAITFQLDSSSSTHSYPGNYKHVRGQLHVAATLPLGKIFGTH